MIQWKKFNKLFREKKNVCIKKNNWRIAHWEDIDKILIAKSFSVKKYW